MRKVIYISLGFLGLAFGALGAALPLMPAFPFLLCAAFCFARGSERINNWYLTTRLYQDNIRPFIKGEGMTRATKLKTITIVTISMAIGFFMLNKIPLGRIILSAIWLCHILYFIFAVRTISAPQSCKAVTEE